MRLILLLSQYRYLYLNHAYIFDTGANAHLLLTHFGSAICFSQYYTSAYFINLHLNSNARVKLILGPFFLVLAFLFRWIINTWRKKGSHIFVISSEIIAETSSCLVPCVKIIYLKNQAIFSCWVCRQLVEPHHSDARSSDYQLSYLLGQNWDFGRKKVSWCNKNLFYGQNLIVYCHVLSFFFPTKWPIL